MCGKQICDLGAGPWPVGGNVIAWGQGTARRKWCSSNTGERKPSRGWGVTPWARLLEKQELCSQNVDLAASPRLCQILGWQPTFREAHHQTEQSLALFLGQIWVTRIYCSQFTEMISPTYLCFAFWNTWWLGEVSLSWALSSFKWRWDLQGTSVQEKTICLILSLLNWNH